MADFLRQLTPWLEDATLQQLMSPNTSTQHQEQSRSSSTTNNNNKIVQLLERGTTQEGTRYLVVHDNKHVITAYLSFPPNEHEEQTWSRGSLLRLKDWRITASVVFEHATRTLTEPYSLPCLEVMGSVDLIGGQGMGIVGNPLAIGQAIEVKRAMLYYKLDCGTILQKLGAKPRLGNLEQLMSSKDSSTTLDMILEQAARDKERQQQQQQRAMPSEQEIAHVMDDGDDDSSEGCFGQHRARPKSEQQQQLGDAQALLKNPEAVQQVLALAAAGRGRVTGHLSVVAAPRPQPAAAKTRGETETCNVTDSKAADEAAGLAASRSKTPHSKTPFVPQLKSRQARASGPTKKVAKDKEHAEESEDDDSDAPVGISDMLVSPTQASQEEEEVFTANDKDDEPKMLPEARRLESMSREEEKEPESSDEEEALPETQQMETVPRGEDAEAESDDNEEEEVFPETQQIESASRRKDDEAESEDEEEDMLPATQQQEETQPQPDDDSDEDKEENKMDVDNDAGAAVGSEQEPARTEEVDEESDEAATPRRTNTPVKVATTTPGGKSKGTAPRDYPLAKPSVKRTATPKSSAKKRKGTHKLTLKRRRKQAKTPFDDANKIYESSDGLKNYKSVTLNGEVYRIGQVVAVACRESTFGDSGTWFPFDQPWSPAQIIAFTLNEHGASTMNVRWFYRLHDLSSFDQKKIPAELKKLEHSVYETDFANTFPISAILGPIQITSDPTEMPLLTPQTQSEFMLLCRYRFTKDRNSGQVDDWDECETAHVATEKDVPGCLVRGYRNLCPKALRDASVEALKTSDDDAQEEDHEAEASGEETMVHNVKAKDKREARQVEYIEVEREALAYQDLSYDAKFERNRRFFQNFMGPCENRVMVFRSKRERDAEEGSDPRSISNALERISS